MENKNEITEKLKPYARIDNELITNINIEDSDLAIFTILKTIYYNPIHQCAIFNLSSLYEVLSSKATTQRNTIKESLTRLIKNKLIVIKDFLHTITDVYDIDEDEKGIENLDTNTLYKAYFEIDYVYDEEFVIYDKGFTPIPYENVYNIINFIKECNKNGFTKYKFFRYYLLIARRCSNDDKCGYISMDKIHDAIGITNKTCIEYNEMLQSIGNIFYNNEYVYTNKLRSACNIYAHNNTYLTEYEQYMDKDFFLKYIDKHIKNNKLLEKNNKKETNNKRSESMKQVWKERKGEIIND